MFYYYYYHDAYTDKKLYLAIGNNPFAKGLEEPVLGEEPNSW